MRAPLSRLLGRDEHLREVVAKTGGNLIFLLGGKLLGICFIWLIIRWYGAAAYGRWALAMTALSVTTVLAGLGLHSAIVRFVAQARAGADPGRLGAAYLRCLVPVGVAGVALGLALFLSAGPLAALFDKPGLDGLLRLAALGVLPLNLVLLNAGALRGLRAVAHGFVEHAGAALLAVLLLAAAYPLSRRPDLFAVAWVAALWLLAAGSSALWVRRSGLLRARPGAKPGFREVFGLSLPMLTTDSMHLLKSWTDVVMIGLLGSELDLAVYGLALAISAAIAMPLMAVNSIAAPKFAELHALGDVDGLSRVARHSTRLVFWLVAPVFVALVLFGRPLLGLFGDELTAGALALAILAAGRFFSAISGSVAPILSMTGHHARLRDIVVWTSALNLVLNLLLIPPYGIAGAAAATALTVVLTNLLCLRRIRKAFGFLPIFVPFLPGRRPA